MIHHKLPTALVFAIILSAALITPVLAVQYNPGVNKGDYVTYGDFVGIGLGFEAFNDYDSLTLTVDDVSGKEVSLQSSGQFKNGTTSPTTTSVWNIETGTENGAESTQGPIIAANLNSGDAIPPPNTFSVNSTENRVYLGFTRSVNILNVAISTPDYNSTLTYVYDKASGMLLEAASQVTAQGDPQPITSQYSYSIIETSIFGKTPTPTNPLNLIQYIVILAIVIIVAVVVVVVALFRKRI